MTSFNKAGTVRRCGTFRPCKMLDDLPNNTQTRHVLEIKVLEGTSAGYPIVAEALDDKGAANAKTRLDPSGGYLRDYLYALETGGLDREQLEQFGSALLFGSTKLGVEGLLQGAVHDLYLLRVGSALSAPEGRLQIRLCIQAPELAGLPWEVLFDPIFQAFLATDPRFALVRSILTPQRVDSMVASLPVRGLIIEADAPDLDHADETERLRECAFQSEGRLEWDRLAGPLDLEAIQAQLRKGPYQLLHFTGHGDFAREGKLFLGANRDSPVSERTFADLMVSHASLRLVVLNACNSAQLDSSKMFSGIARRLLSRSVPAVVAMQRPIRDRSARRFAQSLYETLLSGPRPGDVLAAVNAARLALQVHDDGSQHEFRIPVLYMRSRDEMLFRVETPSLLACNERAVSVDGMAPEAVVSDGDIARPRPDVRQVTSEGSPVATPQSLLDRIAQSARRGVLPSLWLGLILVVVALRWIGWFESADTARQDFYVQNLREPASHPDVRIVDLDDVHTPLGTEVWPQWHRDTFKDLIQTLLKEAKVRTVVVDVRLRRYAGLEDKRVFDQANAELGRIIRAARDTNQSVVLATNGTLQAPAGPDERYLLAEVKPLPVGLEAVQVGYATLLRAGTEGQAVRKVVLTASQRGGPDAFALAAAGAAGPRPPIVNTQTHRVLLGDHWIETDPFFRVELPIFAADMLLVRASEVLAKPFPERVRLELQDKVVVVGLYRNPAQDVIPTPRGSLPGVLIQAGIIGEILSDRCRHRWDTSMDLALQIITFTSLGVWASRVRRRLEWIVKILIVLSTLVVLEVVSLAFMDLWINGPVLEVAAFGLLFGLLFNASARWPDP